MRVVITGSLGNISRPLSEMLIKSGNSVTVISSKPEKSTEIELLGAKAAIGSLTDLDFLAQTFLGADALYAMIPFSFTATDQAAYLRGVANNYVQAIERAGIKRVVLLSGWAANLVPSESFEDVFDQLSDVSLTILRPTVFYSNFYMYMDTIRQQGIIAANYGGEDRLVFVSPRDIAQVAAEELLTSAPSQIRYVGSEEMTCNEAAHIIGTAIGKPSLKWITLSNQQMLDGYKMTGMPNELAKSLVEMQAIMHEGRALAAFHQANPKLGKVKLADFAKEFAIAYNAQ